MKMNHILLLTNGLTLFLLILMAIQENYPQKILRTLKGSADASLPVYLKNKSFRQETDLYKVYHKDPGIVMLGNSITYRVNWSELLDRDDIINRGIENDITAGFLARIDEIKDRQPDVCFIMGGINDLQQGIPKDTILNNLRSILLQLQQSGIRPVLQSILFVGKGFPDSLTMNKQIAQTNASIRRLCVTQGIRFLDLNTEMNNLGELRPEYSIDGIHLNGLGYSVWGTILTRELRDLMHPS